MGVYAIVHNGTGDFMVFFRNRTGYFFRDTKNEGRGFIVDQGRELTGGGLPVFPGGPYYDQQYLAQGAANELFYATGIASPYINYRPGVYKCADAENTYCGVYLDAGNQCPDMLTLAMDNLLIAKHAAAAVAGNPVNISGYAGLMEAYPGCPAHNELDYTGEIWNVFIHRRQIRALDTALQKPFYNMICNLRDKLFPIKVFNRDMELIGGAKHLRIAPGNEYTVTCLVFDNTALLPGGGYMLSYENKIYTGLEMEAIPQQQGPVTFKATCS